jgi:hypothetical protein
MVDKLSDDIAVTPEDRVSNRRYPRRNCGASKTKARIKHEFVTCVPQ